MTIEEVKKFALELVTDHKKIDEDIVDIYWFPCEHELRLIYLDNGFKLSNGKDIDEDNDNVTLFYFPKNEYFGIDTISGQINKKFFGKKKLPDKWGDWSNGIKLD